MSCQSRLERALAGAVKLPLDAKSRYVLISDCHRGTGTAYDNFLKNQHLFTAALGYYDRNSFFYIELGDGEELWENFSLGQIETCYSDLYEQFGEMEQKGRILRLFGNHNLELRNENTQGKQMVCNICGEPMCREHWQTFRECAVLKNNTGGRDICLLHGHQADFFNSVLWKLSRFLVRYLWRPLERFGVNDPTSAAKNYKKQRRYEHCLDDWAKEKGMYLVAGHSHRPTLPEAEGLYANSGSCVHPRCITAIEIRNMKMTLVKWSVTTRPDLSLVAERSVLAGTVDIR